MTRWRSRVPACSAGSWAPHEPRDSILRQLRERIAAVEAAEIARWKAERAAAGDPAIALAPVDRVVGRDGVEHVAASHDAAERYALVRAPRSLSGRIRYQLEGDQLFTLRKADSCMMLLSTRGWITADRTGKVVEQNISSLAYAELCGDAGEWARPLASITIAGRTWWIEQVNVEDGTDYMLLDPLSGDPVEIKGLWELRSNGR